MSGSDSMSSVDEESDTSYTFERFEEYEEYNKESDPDPADPVPVPAQTITLITGATLLPAQKQDLGRVTDILCVKENQARTLLIHYRWDVVRLVEAFVERGTDWLFPRSGIAIRLQESRSSVVTICAICGDKDEDLKEKDITTMDCGHTFCNVCWTEHFLIKINEGHSKRIKCMDPECNIICDEDVVRKLVSAKDPEATQRFNRFLFESYIEDNNNVKWCPSVTNCGNALRVEEVYCEIECICGKQFCFNCLAEPHSPCSCLILELWDKKCKDKDSESSHWIAVNTQPCPKCHRKVEKNGGCNLVSCLCGQHFCWLCGGATGRQHNYQAIDGHTCGSYKEDQEEEGDLKRYTHYFSRWKAHKDSLKLEAKQKNLLEEKISDLESKEPGVRYYSWLTNALERLFITRRALSYSYPFAFYMFGDGGNILKKKMTATEKETNQVLFEVHQQQLEVTVERLSKIIEGPFDEQMDRVQVIDLTVLADRSCRNMYDFIKNDLLTSHGIAPYNSSGVQRVYD